MVKSIISEIREKLFLKGSFVQNMGWTMSGNGIIILSQLIFSPILTRIYGPAAYGSFSLFNAIALNISSISCLQYDKAIILPKSEVVFKALMRLCIYSIVAVFLLVSVFVIAAPNLLTKGLGLPDTPFFLYGLPFFVLILSFLQLSQSWILRNSYFKAAAIYSTPILVGMRVFNIGYGLISKGAIIGISLGEFLGKFLSLIINVRVVLKRDFKNSYPFKVEKSKIVDALKVYKKFPLFDLPATWLNLFTGQLPLYFLGGFVGIGFLGFYGLASSLLEMPIRLLSYSMVSVLTVKVADLQKSEQEDRIASIIEKLFWTLLMLVTVPFVIVVLLGPSLFTWFFGTKWLVAGQLAAVLSMYACTRLIVEPFTGIYRVFHKQQRQLVIQIISLLAQAIILVFLVQSKTNPVHIIGWYAVAASILRVYLLLDVCKVVRMSISKSVIFCLILSLMQLFTVFQLV
jgi:O-antigen/teichoic acid export membrane protein